MKITTKDMIFAALFAALTAVGGFINIKAFSVPLTLQLFFCSFAGVLLGARLGMISQLIYVLVGLMGIPVFVYGGGPSYVFNPTFGYLIGFIVAAYVMGKMVESFGQLSLKSIFIAVTAGLVVAYVIGIPYFYIISKFYLGKSLTFINSIMIMIPYMIKDLILDVVVAVTAWKVLPILRSAGILSVSVKTRN
ncbi:MAG: biotin transport system substrate-specific component [Clostridiales bacterium]|jgi:biotin transport system substrate-specific component|nr:biotin transport system substrate-specific component [Clostridiales bacterium]MDK2933801.1 biotin transport system substrate-specific component [Clostridiales bacterium]